MVRVIFRASRDQIKVQDRRAIGGGRCEAVYRSSTFWVGINSALFVVQHNSSRSSSSSRRRMGECKKSARITMLALGEMHPTVRYGEAGQG